jgi:hypothetical protein
LFGNVTPQPQNAADRNGFEALAVYDRTSDGGNGNGWIDAADSIFKSLLLWQDRNHNGISEPGELTALPASAVAAIDLKYKKSKWVDLHGNTFRYRTKVLRNDQVNGNDKWAYDVFLVTMAADR